MEYLIQLINDFLQLPCGTSTIYIYARGQAKPCLGLKVDKQSENILHVTVDNFVTRSNISFDYPSDKETLKQGAVTEFLRWLNMVSQQNDSLLFIEQTRKTYKTIKGHWVLLPTQHLKKVTQV